MPDDLELLLEEDLSSINLCALYCELRNTEQLLASLTLFAYKVGSLHECNTQLANYGPDNFNSRITVKMKEGQETAVEKHNIQMSLFLLRLYTFRHLLFVVVPYPSIQHTSQPPSVQPASQTTIPPVSNPSVQHTSQT